MDTISALVEFFSEETISLDFAQPFRASELESSFLPYLFGVGLVTHVWKGQRFPAECELGGESVLFRFLRCMDCGADADWEIYVTAFDELGAFSFENRFGKFE